MNPDYTGPQHDEYKGFYKAMRRKHVRSVEPLIHSSVKRRWDDKAVGYKSPGLSELIGTGDWSRVTVVD